MVRETIGNPVHVRLGDLLPLVDAYGRDRGITDRAESIRKLIARGLQDAAGERTPPLSEATLTAVAALIEATIEREYGRGELGVARQAAHDALAVDLAGDALAADIQLRILTRDGMAARLCQCHQLHPHGCPHGSASGSIWCSRHYESDVPALAGALLCGNCHVGEYQR